MYPGFGPTKVEINKRTGTAVPSDEYRALMASQLAMQGSGQFVKNSVDPKYGNPNYPGLAMGENQGMDLQLATSSYSNAPASPPTATTGQLGFFSQTGSPQIPQSFMGEEAERGIRARVMGESTNNNDIAALYRQSRG